MDPFFNYELFKSPRKQQKKDTIAHIREDQ